MELPEFSLEAKAAAESSDSKGGSRTWPEIKFIGVEERARLERLLLNRIKDRSEEINTLWAELNGHWGYEDGFYRYYHGSFKVYGVQNLTSKAVTLLGSLLPERPLNQSFLNIVNAGTGKEFAFEHNEDWPFHTRPILEAFSHSRFMIEMCLRYASLPEPPSPLPSGWAALLYLYGLR
ncbi:MAG: hypothetical protein AB1705_05585 [Verrucomicrobiota bacterium]